MHIGLETTGNLTFPVNKDGAGKRFELTQSDITGDYTAITQPLETNFFVLDVNQHWIYGPAAVNASLVFRASDRWDLET